MRVSYFKEIMVQASHFNDERSYQALWALHDGRVDSLEDLKHALSEIHGHNFRFCITSEGPLDPEEGWVLDDVVLTKLVTQWEGKNLSSTPEFMSTKTYATTEMIAVKMLEKLQGRFPNVNFTVVVWENPFMNAIASTDGRP